MATKTIATFTVLAGLLVMAADARADGPGLADKCRETGDHRGRYFAEESPGRACVYRVVVVKLA